MSAEAAEAPPLVRMCKEGIHELPLSSGQCPICRRNRERREKATKAALARKARGLDPLRMCGRGLHRMSGKNLVKVKRTRIDGTPYEIERCFACSTGEKRKASEPGKAEARAAQRMADARRIAEIEAEILTMCDAIELASTYELSVMRERRAALVRERDALERGSINTELRAAAIRNRGAYRDSGN